MHAMNENFEDPFSCAYRLYTNSSCFFIQILCNHDGTEAEIQLPLKSFPDSSVSSLIPPGWCEEGCPTTKNSLKHSHGLTDNCLLVTERDFLEIEASVTIYIYD